MPTNIPLFDPVPFASKDLNIPARQVVAVAKLFAEGNAVPFIARYRKEAHGNLDEVQISDIQEKLTYYNTLEARRQTILKSIEEQGKLTNDLRLKIEECQSKTTLEDLYLPYKPKRRTRAIIAKEKGLEPLAELIWQQGQENPAVEGAVADGFGLFVPVTGACEYSTTPSHSHPAYSFILTLDGNCEVILDGGNVQHTPARHICFFSPGVA